ncbi:hypothetical protein CDFC105_31827 [Clostridioides difficile]|nr:hypothetical protein CDFC105_31827 [Clostridioides difficile]
MGSEMCIRDSYKVSKNYIEERKEHLKEGNVRAYFIRNDDTMISTCLLYTSDAADDSLRVDLGGLRVLKKKK